ncbi:hypothetical protein Ahy_A02g008948 [Arachis hypogaea]|uniref:DUF4283 domain-containing protein n=1 Tax=Arachis hypogaea TaxID=3818 RepID=A0A445EFS3_ARAHY|nr:hypothetical protein Ahy_A02g008948 [Arachis hypogaea]
MNQWFSKLAYKKVLLAITGYCLERIPKTGLANDMSLKNGAKYKPWKNALIVKLLGKRVGLAFIEQHIERDWIRKGTIDVIDMDRDYFLIHFSNDEDYSHTLMKGPWMIAMPYCPKMDTLLLHIRECGLKDCCMSLHPKLAYRTL